MTDKTKLTAPPSDSLYTPRLRQKKRSYAESGLGTPVSEIKTNTASKKLVYLQNVNTDQSQETHLDLYEFDSDSEGIRPTRKKRAKRSGAKKTPTRRAKRIPTVIAMMEETKSENAETKPEDNHHEENVQVSTDNHNIFGSDGIAESYMSKVTVVKLQPDEELNLSVVNTAVVQKDCGLTPWRFTDSNVRRNPLFLQLKDSSLPRLDQEMVLDHSIVENFENSSKVAIPSTKKSRQKKRRQRNITDYFDSNGTTQQQREASLFEDGGYSPSEDLLDNDEAEAFVASTPRHHEGGGKLELSVSEKNKTYSRKPKQIDFTGGNSRAKTTDLKENLYFEDETSILTPKLKRGGNRNNHSHKKKRAAKIGKEEEEAELLFANLSLEYEKIENFPLLIDN